MSNKALVGVGIVGAIAGLAGLIYGIRKSTMLVKPNIYKAKPEFMVDNSAGLYVPQYDKW